ncbi:MAG: 3'(2'),5'-bisphosphate nucleotidase CysQ [Bacteroidaceae bacterium]|nr:3'(2'),5'-bisphosphate nucleotidase CysQ [Bacteroidaceae bacterium]
MINVAVDAALEAGREIMRIYLDPKQDFGIEKKSDNSPLTIADRVAHDCIVRHLAQTGIPILSEEGAHLPYEERKAWHRLWIVDPLDGTKEFIKRNGEFTVNIALVEAGVPVLGVIYAPAQDVLYTGIVENDPSKPPFEVKAWRKGSGRTSPLPLGEDRDRAFTIVASRSHMNPETEEFISMMRRKYDDIRIVSSGSSLKMCLVAEGTADVYPRFAPTMEWDTAAGDAIVRAAGKMVVNAQTGQPLTYNKPDLHNPWFIVQ